MNMLQKITVFFLLLLSTNAFAATYRVTRFDDPVVNSSCSEFNCSLRQAVIAANSSPGHDEIILLPIEHELRVSGHDDAAQAGDLDITDELTITGEFISNVPLNISSIDTAVDFQDRIFDVHPGVTLMMRNMRVRGGKTLASNGGGFRVIGGEVMLENVYLIANKALYGSGIYARNSMVKLQNVTVSLNQNTSSDGFGAGVFLYGGQLQINDSNLSENFSDYGGAIAALNFVDLFGQPAITIDNSRFFDNAASEQGGAIYLDGGISNDKYKRNVRVSNSVISLNEAIQGGGIYHQGSELTLSAVTLRKNKALSVNGGTGTGGAIYSGDGALLKTNAVLNVEHSLIHENISYGQAGSIYYNDPELNVVNTTFSQNQGDHYAGLYVDSGQVLMQHNSILLNESNNGEDIYLGLDVEAVIQNNIFMARCTTTFFTTVLSMGGNIETPGDSCQLDPNSNDLFGSLQRGLLSVEITDNGGPTQTHAITNPFSQAIDHGINTQGTPYDQRYYLRDTRPDSGAFEWQSIGVDRIFSDDFEVEL